MCVPKEKVQNLAGFAGIQGGVQDIWWRPVVRRRRDYLRDQEVLVELHVEHECMQRPGPDDGQCFLLG